MDHRDLAFTPALDLAARIRRKELSPVEAVEGALSRIEQLNPTLNAFAEVAGRECQGGGKNCRSGRPARRRTSGRFTASRSASKTR